MTPVEMLTAAIAYDSGTRDHIHRVRRYAVGLARALGVNDGSLIDAIDEAALLHDIGKVAISQHILNKPDRLTESEFNEMKQHVDLGADMLAQFSLQASVVPIVRSHHENWDGTGYLRGLQGREIPIGARIVSVVDCFDALTSDRPYRPRLPKEEAMTIVLNRRGTMYDPAVVDAFVRVCQMES
jgi:putative nucleotidyltransferase with HDIG domain